MSSTKIPTIIPPNRPRWLLHYQAQTWRYLMAIGMTLHKLAKPHPPKPNFSRAIPTTISPRKGSVRIQFYVPAHYDSQKTAKGKRFPVIVNFHGGGFTLGCATDDARWAAAAVEQVGAVVASVDYRRAPEHHFPTAVEDGVDAIMYLAQHADELWLDVDRIAVSGFSSGGNMAFTVPLRLQEETDPDFDVGNMQHMAVAGLEGETDTMEIGNTVRLTSTTTPMSPHKQGTTSDGQTIVRVMREIRIAAIVAWYPSTDYTVTRAERRETSVRKDQDLPAVFTELFDDSYLQPPTMDMSNPYLSPGVAPRHMLKGLPENIILTTVEFDMLLAEGKRLRERLEALGKKVSYHCVEGAHHGWDKSPNPFRLPHGAKERYDDVCKELVAIFAEPV